MRTEVALSRDTSRPASTYLRKPSAGSLFMEFVFISWQVILSKIFFSISGESSSSLLWSWLKWSDCQCIRHSGEGSSVGRWSVDEQELSHPGLVSVGLPRFAGWEASALSAGNQEEQFQLLSPRFRRTFTFAFITMWNPHQPTAIGTCLELPTGHFLCARHFPSMLLFALE